MGVDYLADLPDDEVTAEIAAKTLNFLMLCTTSTCPNAYTTTENIQTQCFPNTVVARISTQMGKRIFFAKVMEMVELMALDIYGYTLRNDATINKNVYSDSDIIPDQANTNNTKEKNDNTVSVDLKFISVNKKDSWYLVNGFKTPETKIREAEKDSDESNATRGLLFLILSFILLQKEKRLTVNEDTLAEMLDEKAGIQKKLIMVTTSGSKANFGPNIKGFEDVVREFCSTGYLKKQRNHGDNDSQNQYGWELTIGPRAFMEFGLENIFNFINGVNGIELKDTEKDMMVGKARLAKCQAGVAAV